MMGFITHHKAAFIRTIVVLLLLIVWHIGSLYLPSILLPSPLATFKELIGMTVSGELVQQMGQSLYRMLIGLCIGTTAAILLGLVAGRFNLIYEGLRPVYSLILGLPPIIVVVLAMVWFGTGSIVPIFVVAILVFPVTYLNTAEGWRNIDKQLIEMALIYKTSVFQTLQHVILPSLAVPILTAVTLSVGSAVRITIMAELLGADNGIGYSLALARVNINTAKVLAWAIVSVLIIILLDHFVLQPFKRYLLRWKDPARV